MKENFKTPQEEFWAGEFGNEYTDRNDGPHWIASNINLFSKVLGKMDKPSSVLELGCNKGLNLRALQILLPDAKLEGVEINEKAANELESNHNIKVHQQSLFDYKAQNPSDLVLIKGVMIHLNPEMLSNAYQVMYDSSSKYILVCEYYNPSPVTINYRGHSDRLFKRDFAGEMMEKYPDLKLLDYGFCYHKDPVFPQDDITWFLMEKTK